MPDTSRQPLNPLALAVLVLLYERPMHPYEMASTLKERRKESSIRLNYGNLYNVIERLLREKLIGVRETVKQGKLPEKTVYELTAAGEAEMTEWMRELVSSPVKEYPRFEAALSLLPALLPEEVIDLLEIRIGLLEKTIKEIGDEERACQEMKLPRLFSLESEYYKALTLAEYKFSKDLLSDLKRDTGGLRSGWSRVRAALVHPEFRRAAHANDARKEHLASKGGAQKNKDASGSVSEGLIKEEQGWSKKHLKRIARRWAPK
jgi:DNA-binding PadR family transcriptional regulator